MPLPLVASILLTLPLPIIELVAKDMAAELMPATVVAVVVMALSMLPFVDGDEDVDAVVGNPKKGKIENNTWTIE